MFPPFDDFNVHQTHTPVSPSTNRKRLSWIHSSFSLAPIRRCESTLPNVTVNDRLHLMLLLYEHAGQVSILTGHFLSATIGFFTYPNIFRDF